MDILISTRHINLLHRYAAKTGMSIDMCVHDALTEWFRKGAPGARALLGLSHATQLKGGQTLGASSRMASDGSDSSSIASKIKTLLRYGRT